MRFSSDFLERLREHIVLSDLVSLHTPLKKKGKIHLGLCPFHSEKTPSFTVTNERQTYHCFGCGVHGNAYNFLMKTQNFSFPEAVTFLAAQAGVPLEEVGPPEDPEKTSHREALYKVHEDACTWFESQFTPAHGRVAQDYIMQRGISLETAKTFRLGYAPGRQGLKTHLISRGYSEALLLEAGLLSQNDSTRETYDRFRDRLIFPITNKQGRVVGFGGRLLKEGVPKYLNSPETSIFLKGRLLYGMRQTDVEARKNLIIVEGYMDVIALHQAGIRTAVAPLGTAVTEEQILEAWKICPSPALCFDGDTAGQQASLRVADKALPLLKSGYSLKFVHLPAGEDPDSLVRQGSQKTLLKLIRTARPLFEVLWEAEAGRNPTATPENLASFKSTFLSKIQNISDFSLKSVYKSEFNKRFFETFYRKKPTRFDKRTPEKEAHSAGVHCSFDPFALQRKILFALIVNHPQLVHKVGEEFALLSLPDPSLEVLRDEIFLAISEAPDLDVQQLRSYLLDRGFEALLKKILHRDVYVHAAFAHPGGSLDQALNGWLDIWQRLKHHEHLKQDVQSARRTLKQGLTPDAWNRYRDLKKYTYSE